MANFINVKGLKYALLTKDEAGELTYGALKTIPGLVKISVEPTSSEASFYGDGQKMEVVKRLSDIKVSIQASTLDMATLSELLGHEYDATKGLLTANQDNVAPYVGLIYTREKADGTARHIKLFKMMFSLPKEEASSNTNNVSFQDNTIEAVALPTTKDGRWKEMIEPNETNTAEITAFLASIVAGA